MASDVEIERALNALNTTLNDHRPQRLDVRAAQELVDGATGEQRVLELRQLASGDAAAMHDLDGTQVAQVRREGEGWVTERTAPPAGGAYVPPPPDPKEARKQTLREKMASALSAIGKGKAEAKRPLKS